MVGNLGAIHVWIMHAKFKPSSFNGVGGGGGDRRTKQTRIGSRIWRQN